ncbi:hypothetical protein HPB47_024993, partial [Ixodes persulcatus]
MAGRPCTGGPVRRQRLSEFLFFVSSKNPRCLAAHPKLGDLLFLCADAFVSGFAPTLCGVWVRLGRVEAGAETRHSFRSKQFRKTQRCDLCQQPLRDQGASCKACKYCCHLHCEPK